jgi:hypothetical protein
MVSSNNPIKLYGLLAVVSIFLFCLVPVPVTSVQVGDWDFDDMSVYTGLPGGGMFNYTDYTDHNITCRYPTRKCGQAVGGSYYGNAYSIIVEETATDNYMQLYSFSSSCSLANQFSEVNFHSNITNFTGVSSMFIEYNYKSEYQFYDSCYELNDFTIANSYERVARMSDSTADPLDAFGSYLEKAAGTFKDYNRDYTDIYNTYIPSSDSPITISHTDPRYRDNDDTSLCVVDDGAWHNIRIYYEFANNTATHSYIKYSTMEVDGSQCYERNFTADSEFNRNLYNHMLLFQTKNTIIDIDDLKIYYNEIPTSNTTYNDSAIILNQIDSTAECPVENCLFYDNFDYELNDTEWSMPLVVANLGADVIDSALYFNDTGYRSITSPYWKSSADNIAQVILRFAINDTTVPITLENETAVYRFEYVTASGETVNTLALSISKYDATHVNINVYDFENNQLKLINSETWLATEEPMVFTTYDYANDKIYYNVQGFTPTWYTIATEKFKYMKSKQMTDHIMRVIVKRIDADNDFQFGFFGLDTIIAKSGNKITYDLFDPYTYDVDAGYIENPPENGSIEVTLHDTAESLGFSSTGGKLLFWLILMVLITLLSVSVFEVSWMRVFMGGTMFVCLFIAGKLMGFIPTVVFTFVLLILLVAVAYFIASKFSSG